MQKLRENQSSANPSECSAEFKDPTSLRGFVIIGLKREKATVLKIRLVRLPSRKLVVWVTK